MTRKFRVIGRHAVAGISPGDVGFIDNTRFQIRHLIAAGHIEDVTDKPELPAEYSVSEPAAEVELPAVTEIAAEGPSAPTKRRVKTDG